MGSAFVFFGFVGPWFGRPGFGGPGFGGPGFGGPGFGGPGFGLRLGRVFLLGIGTPLQLQQELHGGHFCACEDEIYSKHTKPNRTITEDFMVEQQKMQAVPK